MATVHSNHPQFAWETLLNRADLAVEIVSSNDRYSDIQAKVALYQSHGVRLIWILDPNHRRVSVYQTQPDTYALLGETDTLSGEDILPDLTN